MTNELATVKAHVSNDGDGTPHEPAGPAEQLRLQFAEAWGEMSASWGVAPAIGRVHAYLMVRNVALTEREIREALGLSHRAASLALTDAETWGIVERVSEPRRVGRRGPAGTAYMAVGDHWQWFTRVIAERKVREGDPIVEVIARTASQAGALAAAHPGDAELAALRELERGMRLLGEVSDDTVLRLVHLLGSLPDDDVLDLIEALSRLSPTAARRATKLMSGVVRTIAR
jgi:DNA-binding transcriptional regulator GbsR (MarR family)